MNRRTFLRNTGAALFLAQAGCATAAKIHSSGLGADLIRGKSMCNAAAKPIPYLRIGVIGVGNRGPAHVKALSAIPGVEITALCDIHQERTARWAQWLADNGKARPREFFGSQDAWRAMVESDLVDMVYIATPWLWHTPMAAQTMLCGKHAAVEVPAAVTLEECWQLVETSEKTRMHCVMLENCCYGRNEMLALSLCRAGVLGDLVHGEAAYLHELAGSKLRKRTQEGDFGRWRLEWTKQHDGNPYPTHGLGPICQYMGVNRGDRFEYLASVSSGIFRMPQLGRELFGEKAPEAKRSYYRQGDFNTTIIRTYRGRTILVEHDTTTPAPYSRLNNIRGTKGVLYDYPLRIALLPKPHEWLDEKKLGELKSKYDHPLWRDHEGDAKKNGGHGGMDYMMSLRLCHCIQRGLPVDMDVYDAALWSSLVELTERSVLRNGSSVTVPDFTRGTWKTAEPLGIATV